MYRTLNILRILCSLWTLNQSPLYRESRLAESSYRKNIRWNQPDKRSKNSEQIRKEEYKIYSKEGEEKGVGKNE